jgi:hypothetical protein
LPGDAAPSQPVDVFKKALACLIVAAALTGVAAGCGKSDEEKATDQACDARDDIAKQVKELQGLTLTTATTSQVSEHLKAIRDDLVKITDSQADLSDERRAELEQANDAFGTALRETAATVGTTTSVEDAKTKLETAFDKLAASYRGAFAGVDCPE